MDNRLSANEPQQRVEKSFPTRYLRFEDFCFDLQGQVLSKNGERICLVGKTYEVMRVLLEKPGQIVSREELRIRLWPGKTTLNYDANINTIVNKLRQVLGGVGDASTLIETVPRKGYILVAKVEHLDRPAPISSSPPKKEPTPEKTLRTSTSWSVIGTSRGGLWFAAGVISLVVGAMLLGAAITLYLHRAF
jgi:DNA-binding winged helix-turn-helix (wHTH) protein